MGGRRIPPREDGKVINGPQIADEYGCDTGTVYRMTRQGLMPEPIRSDWREISPRSWTWSRRKIIAWIEGEVAA